jgi:hypothetical protein
LRNSSRASILFVTTVLPPLGDLVEDDAVVVSFNDLQAVVLTPLRRTLLRTSRARARDASLGTFGRLDRSRE